MSEPLDFRFVEGKPAGAAPEPPKAGRRTRPPLVMVLAAAAALAVAAFVAFRVVGGGSSSSDSLGATRYCQLATQLDAVSLDAKAASAPGVYDGTTEQIKVAVDAMGASLQEMRSVAPKATRKDVGTITSALGRAADGDPGAVRSPSFTGAFKAASTYRATTCAAGSGSGDG